jgi:antitoxin ParD1/3/4
MNVSLTPEFEAMIQSKIATGLYTNASEVIRDALRRMDEQDPFKDLRSFFAPRIAEARRGELSNKSFNTIIAEAKRQATKTKR